MLGLDYKTTLLKDLVEILDTEESPLTVEEIRLRLGYSNAVTILKSIKELRTIIDNRYTDEKYFVRLVSPKRGVFKLERQATNLQTLFEAIYANDIAYDILLELIEKRQISAVNFSMKHNISHATFFRKIRLINEELKAYNIAIARSAPLKFDASELDIRIFSYIFFWGTNRQFSNALLKKNYPNIQMLTTEVLKALKISSSPLHVELLSIWLFIYSNSLSKKYYLQLKKEQEATLHAFSFPKKPSVISTWSQVEWEMLVMTIYSSDIYNFTLKLNESYHSSVIDEMNISKQLLERLVKKYFVPLNGTQQKSLSAQWTKIYLSNYFARYTDKAVKDIEHIVSITSFRHYYPNYWKRFASLWTDFMTYVNYKEHYGAVKFNLLMMMISVFPIEKFENLDSKVKICVVTDVSDTFTSYIKQLIKLQLGQRFQIRFVTSLTTADIIVATSPFDIEQLKTHQKSIIISPQMREVDMRAIQKKIEAFFH
ncbi:hypothetical protein IGI37_003813 [Enterococcus sp. AZ194]|uniref:helix-turn-helix domain-containing protein n=1 Tax=Enterococcus sp. AZ194 TaxID=2774629 RepID=UPI003F231EB8